MHTVMSTPVTKRRRLNDASHTLSKPFKSPLKTPLLAKGDDAIKHETSQEQPLKGLEGAESHGNRGVIQENASTPSQALEHAASKKIEPNIKYLPTLSYEDGDLSSMLKTQRGLESELRNLREEVETFEQAVRIESSGEDDELEKLIHKWRVASREAADEMFTSVRDRVNRMGGPAAWREMQRNKAEWRSGGFDEPEEKKAGSDDEEATDVEKRDLYAEYDIEPDGTRGNSGGEPVDEWKEDDVRRANKIPVMVG
ncbi:MAG: hypothetical protein M1812_003454 [Candelaria pacifica]|nr:MAG: hypothetical protein M1812_003454 [Candelaria pacifica]